MKKVIGRIIKWALSLLCLFLIFSNIAMRLGFDVRFELFSPASPSARAIYDNLHLHAPAVHHYLSRSQESHEKFPALAEIPRGRNIVDLLFEVDFLPPQLAGRLAFYITDNAIWMGYDLTTLPPDRLWEKLWGQEFSKRIRECLVYYAPDERLYGSLNVDIAPVSNDPEYLFKETDNVVWIDIEDGWGVLRTEPKLERKGFLPAYRMKGRG